MLPVAISGDFFCMLTINSNWITDVFAVRLSLCLGIYVEKRLVNALTPLRRHILCRWILAILKLNWDLSKVVVWSASLFLT